MIKSNSLGNRLIALMLSIIMVLGMLPANVFALDSAEVAQIGDITYDTLANAIAAVPSGTDQVTTIKLLQNTEDAFDVGISTGSTTKNLKLDLNGKTLTLSPSVGSVGTKSSGIRVLAYSKLEITNGTLVCSSTQEDNVRVGIANYGTLTLTDVEIKKGELTQYTINNRGALTLNGKTTIESGSICAITNDPYDLYYTTNVNASVTCNSSEVEVESMLVERYERNSDNKGGVELNISAGYFGKIVEDGHSAVSADYSVTGGTIGVSTAEELAFALNIANAGAEYDCPQQPVTIKLLKDMAGSFDVGISTGKAPKNIRLDLNGKTLTLKPGIGSDGTKVNGIRVLAYSKLEIANGMIVCSDLEEDKVKVGIANYSKLILDSVELLAGAQTLYTVNNRGELILKGKTKVKEGAVCAITNDPYDLYYTTNVDASLTCDSSDVSVDSVLLERYERNSENKGGLKVNITAGYFGSVLEDDGDSVSIDYNIKGGSFGSDMTDFVPDSFACVEGENGNYVVKAKQDNFGFVQEKYTVTFGANGNKFTLAAQNATGEVTYSFVNATDVAQINAQTGELTILKAGTVQVKAVAAGNAEYVEAEDLYTLVIKPAYAEVHSFSGGTVTRSGSADTVVSIDNASLEWVAKDESIGRTQDGWWVGIKIVAPDGVDLSKAVYQRRSGGSYDGAEVKPFVPESDRYLGMWGLITADYLESFSKDGKKLNYVWRFSWDGDDVYEQTIAITIDPNGITLKQSGFAFGIDEETITYGESYTVREPSGGQASKVSYSVENVSESDTAIAEIDPETGVLTVNKAGTVKITATLSGDHYENISDSYILVIKKADQTGFAFENAPSELTWQKETMDAFALINGKGEGAVTWSIINGTDVATVSADGKITLLKAGTFTIQAQKAEDDCYNASEIITAIITVNPAAQKDFGFGETEKVTVTYNDNGNKYTLAATGGQSSKDIVYTVISGDAATVDETSGVVSIAKAGTVIIQATKPADDQYKEITDTYELTIEKDEQRYTLTETGTVALKYGTTSYTNIAKADTLVSKKNKPVYTISQNAIGASVNGTTGEVTFADSEGKIGKATITVTVAEDDCYKQFTASYEIDVSYLTTDAKPTTDGETKNTSGWYTDKVVIKAPAGYSVAYDNKLSTEWKPEIPYTAEGINDATVFLKDANGYITDKIAVADIMLDTGDPDEQAIAIEYDTPTWEKILEKIGIYKAETLLVKISAKDTNSGIASLTYNIGGEDIVINFNGEGAVSHSFTINAQYRNKITLKATDVAGREVSKDSKHTLVLDTKVPELDTEYEYASNQHREENDIFYTQGDVTVYFTIKETNFDLSNKPVVTVDGVEKSVTWTRVENTDEWKSDLTLTGNGDYVVKVTFTDIATNEMVTYEQEIRIDEKTPELVVDFDNDSAKNVNNYKADRNATITITEHNFKAEEVVVSVTAKNILDQNVDVMDYAAYAKNPANWDSDGDVHTLVLPFTVDAIYSFTVDYTDLSGRAATGYAADFVIDHTPATDIEITYNTPIIEKVWQFLTFGIYKAKAEVTITAKDMTSGVDYFVLTYTKAAEASSINKETFTTDPLPAVKSSADASVFTATYTLEHEADGTFSVVLFDKADNKSEDLDEKRIVVDMKNPLIDVDYEFASGKHNYENNIYYTQGNTAVKFSINEANFHLADKPVLTVNGVEKAVEWVKTQAEDVWQGVYNLVGDGDYKLQLTFTDASTNAMETYQQEIRIDSVKPVIEFSYDNNTYLNENCYKGDRTATIKVTEHNFKPQNVDLKVVAEDIFGDPVSVMDYLAYAQNPANWDSDGDVHTLEVPFTTDAVYNVTVDCEDLAGNSKTNVQPEFVIDHTPVENIQISYSSPVLQTIIEKLTFGFYKAEVVVTVTAEDLTSGVDYFELTYTRDPKATDAHAATETWTLQAQPGENAKTFTASKTVPAQARGNFSVVVYDKAGNPEDANDNSSMIVTDTVNSQIKVEFTELEYEKGFRDADNNIVAPGEAAKFYYNKDVTAKITIEEANFFEGKKAGANDEGIVHQVVLKVTKTDDNGVVTVKEYLCAGAEQLVTGAQKEIIEWTTIGDVHTTSITFADDGDYVLELTYQDFSGNDATINGTDGNSGNVNYTSRIITVDKTKPVIDVSYDNNTALNGNCYKDSRTATITVTEHNFKAEEFVVDVDTENLLGDITVADYAAYAKNPDNWKHDGNVHTLELLFKEDATYTFDLSYTDMAGNAADDFAAQTFVVDHTTADNIQITYTTPVFSKIIEALSFGFYKAEVVVTVTAEDITSGVDYFELTYTRDEDATDAHTDDFMQKLMAQPGADAKTFTASYTVPAQARGSYSVKVYDRAGNPSEADDHESVIVTDTISPEIKVDFTAKDSNTKVHFVDANTKNVDTFAESTNAFFGGDVVATVTVDEANFFEGKKAGANNEEIVHEIIIKVTKTDDNGVKTVKEYLCAGAEQLVTGAQKEIIEWTTNGDIHTTSITFADDGDYVLEITYSDFSENDSKLNGNDGVTATKTYTSKIITVDETAPVIDVTYGNTEVINTIENIKYFNKTQSAVIKVTEHNFRAEDIVAIVTAKNVVDADVNVANFAAQLANEANWKHDGNVHTAEVQYIVDANYTFDIDFVDLALNASADYTKDLFTVDTTAPKNLTVDYSTSVFEQIKESITFGYYNAMMTVTITAEDDTSGIYHFAYSYIKGKDVSGVNAELLDQAIKEAEIKYEGNKATATFNIPKMVLGADNQFNGTVEFTAFDRSEITTELKDSTVIVVDNITPTSKITYNAPVQTANGISYYDGDINATIVVTEANFDAKDVVVTVTKDGENFPVNVSWKDDSVDTHIGMFTLTQDGDYIVSVQYKDKSGNQMTSYKSNELTLDATNPTIKVSNIKANSANKDEKYSFVITVNDTNLDASSLMPVLKAVVQKKEGVYATVDIDLGDAKTVVNGQTYTYTVEDLPDDGLYTLTCSIKDMSSNGMSQIVLDDSESYDQVQFSINRNGSAFGYGNKFSEELVGQYYIYSVDEDVVIVEVNVDPIEEYKVTLNGKELTEGTDYTTVQTSEGGEWSKRTYTIKKAMFEAEGEYSIIVSSTDKADTTVFSDVKNLSLAFVVDQTKPVLTITGLEAGGRYQTDAQNVTLIPTDEGGRLNSLTVLVLDSNGNPLKDDSGADISVRFEMSGEELLKHLEDNDGKVTFTIPEGLNNQVKIICNDCAVNAEDLTNEYNELFERVTVSQNQFVIFYANTPLFVGTIAGVLALIALIIFLIKRKNNKKNKTAAKA